MSDSLTLDKLVVVSPRFARSVSLVRDAHRIDALDGYILTPTGRNVLRRLSDALRGDAAARAWSLTGPYGSGKSAFALFAAQLLAGEEDVRQHARKFLAGCDADLSERLFGASGPLPRKVGRLCPVLVTGSRQPLEKALASSLALSLRTIAQRGRPPQIVERLERLAVRASVSGTAIVGLFEEANEYLDRFGNAAAGILLIVDELGKFLEYGAMNPEQGDVFVLQELAEAATRSKRPFLFVTILHQALDRYAEHMTAGRRAEWAKVQGRFEDVAFEERTEQIIRLLSHAVRHQGAESDLRALRKQAKAYVQYVGPGLRCGSMPPAEMQNCLAACFPLHPLTTFILGPLFRQLAQNERSLFAFLASSEPFGFQQFLREATLKDGPYRLDQLYDYVMASLGPTLFAQARGKLWAEVLSALDRLNDATDLEIRLAKTIGLLQALGTAAAIPASVSTLQAALKGSADEAQIDQAVQRLSQRSVVVFRRHTGSYALWEGSDVDIDDRLQAARQSVERDQSLAAFLSSEAPPQPLIARRHYFQTGTLRYFETRYADRGDFQADLFRDTLSADTEEADGRVVYCLPRDPDDREAMRGFIQSSPANVPVIVALPQDVFDLRELCHELVCLRWVTEHTPELETDRTARRELHARLAIAEQNLRSHLERLFSPASAGGCAWYYQGQTQPLSSQRELNDLLSRACDEVYRWTPRWRNELVNRRSLSSSAAAARRNLIEEMFEHPEEDTLGFTGSPPERSMYETLLKGSRLHRKQGGVFGFHPPDGKAEDAVREMWKAVEGFLTETDAGRQPVGKLFGLLRQPPFGLKDGVLPVILAAILVHGHSQIALYEEGSFVPRPSAAVFERLFRSPQKFELQRFRIAGPRAEVFQQYASMLTRAGGEPDVLGIVRPLVRVVKELPDYVGKTRQISETAQRVLRAVKEARQPDRLLFIDLPAACGFSAFEAAGEVNFGQVDAFFAKLRSAFAELQRAYPHLLSDIEGLILKAFGQEAPLAAARQKIEHNARIVLNVAVDQKLKAFLLRAADNGIEDATWLESIATLLAGKPPTHWDDQDRARFEVQMAASARTFEHFRVLAFEMERSGTALLDGDPRLFRISVTAPDDGELERVVQVPAPMQHKADRAREQVLRILQEEGLLDKKEVGVAVLGELVRQLLAEAARAEKRTS